MTEPVADPTRFPIVINCRDRLEPLAELVAWLERADQGPILLVDNDSTYPPLLDYYERTPHEVIRLGQNAGPYAPWTSGVVPERLTGQWYAATDPDIVPDEGCPLDALAFFYEVLQRYPAYPKAGFGLRIDDLPDRYRFAAEVRDWERRFWADAIEPGLYASPIDTTFALYRPGVGFQIDTAIRTGEPYTARHTAWYTDSDNPSEEERWYRARARPEVNHWNRDELPDWLAEAVERIRSTGDPRPEPPSSCGPAPQLEETPESGSPGRIEQAPAVRRRRDPSGSVAGGWSVRVQSVLYGNDPPEVARFLTGLARAAERAKQAKTSDVVTCWLGDCSAEPRLAPVELQALRRRHASLDRLEYRFLGENLGHGGAHNRLLVEDATEDVTLLVNPDTYASPWLLMELLDGLADPCTAVVEARQLPFEHPKHYDPQTGLTGWASGACSLVRTKVLDEVGGFDADSFFLHGDDVDLSWRVRLAGHHIRHRPAAVVFHHKLLRGSVPAQSAAERVHSAEAAIMLGWKWSRPDVVEHWSRWFAASGDPAYEEAARRYRTRVEEGRLPAQLDPDGGIAEFVESHYAVHRF